MSGNEPAFPIEITPKYEGMTKREYFAATADVPIETAERLMMERYPDAKPSAGEMIKFRAQMKVAEADALIAALNEPVK